MIPIVRALTVCLLILVFTGCDATDAGSFDRKRMESLARQDATDAGPFDRKRMESLVRQVRQQSFTGRKTFFWQNVGGAATLVPDTRQRRVWALRDEKRRLTMVIQMNGGSHYGSAGFAYSDAPFVRASSHDLDPPGGCTLELPGPLNAAFPAKQIDAHWWQVFDNVN